MILSQTSPELCLLGDGRSCQVGNINWIWYSYSIKCCSLNKSNHYKHIILKAIKMAQWVKVFAAKPDDLGLISTPNMVERKNWISKIILWPTHTPWKVCAHGHIHILNKQMEFTYHPELMGHAKHKGQGKTGYPTSQAMTELSSSWENILIGTEMLGGEDTGMASTHGTLSDSSLGVSWQN